MRDFSYQSIRSPSKSTYGKTIPFFVFVLLGLLGGVIAWLLISIQNNNESSKIINPISTQAEEQIIETPSRVILPIITPKPITSIPKSMESVIITTNQLTADKQGVYGWYTRSLVNGDSFGIGYDFAYTAASINKVPIISFFLVETERGIVSLDGVYSLKPNDIESGSGYLQYEDIGAKHSYKELILMTGKQSDNTAALALVNIMGVSDLQKYIDMIGLENTNIMKNTTTPRDMVELLDLIYHDKIFSTNDSKTLFYDSLSHTDYEDRITPGVPNGVEVIHKTGNQIQVWSDCGIINTNKPYALCILTDGIKEREAQEALPKISRIIWDYQTSQ